MLKLGFLSLTIAIAAACGVYGLKNRVQLLEKELSATERMIQAERIDIKRLKAEWATLSRPERLARLAEQHLGLEAATPTQIVSFADVPLRDDLDREPAPALVSAAPSAAVSLRPTVSLR